MGPLEALGDITQDALVVNCPSPDATGADVVVVAAGERLADVAAFVARSAPAAVIVATDPVWCDELLRASLLPRGRVIAAGEVAAAVDAVLSGSGAVLELTVRHDGEHGREGFARARARVGSGGVLDIVA